MVRSRLVLFPLFNQLRLTTTGSNQTWSYLELSPPAGLSELLPHAEALTLFYDTEARSSTEFAWSVFFTSAYRRSAQSNTYQNLGGTNFEITSIDSLRVDYNNANNFNLETRFLVGCKNKAGSLSTALEWGLVSATLGVRLFGA